MKASGSLMILIATTVAFALPAIAQTLTGSISFAGEFSPIPNDGVSMVSNLDYFNIGSLLFASGGSGNFAGLNGISFTGTFPFGLDTSGGPQPLYSKLGYDFYLTEVTTVNRFAPSSPPGNPSGLTDSIFVSGKGYATGPGYVATNTSFSFSAQGTGINDGNGGFLPGGTASWSSSISANGVAYVPEPSAALLSVVGVLALLRRKR